MQTLQQLLNETINRSPCVYTCPQRSHLDVKDPVVHVSLVDYGNTKITQHALKVSVFRVLKLDTIYKCIYMEEKEKRI